MVTQHLYTDFMTALPTIAKKRHDPHERQLMKKMWPIHTVGHCPAMKMGKARTHATTQMDPENTMLGRRSQAPKTRNCRIPFIGNVQNKQTHRGRKQINGR